MFTWLQSLIYSAVTVCVVRSGSEERCGWPHSSESKKESSERGGEEGKGGEEGGESQGTQGGESQ